MALSPLRLKIAGPRMRRLFLRAFSLLLLIFLLAQRPSAHAQAGDPWQLIAEVNALRASYGLPPYEVDNALMAAAQAHSEYQAQLGTWTHSGPGGSRPHDRAVAAGYGGGAQVYVSENVAVGPDLSPSATVYQLWQDAVHLDTMISPNYTHIGAGAAEAGGDVYYTIDVGYIAGEPGAGAPPSGTQPAPGGTPAATALAMVPIAAATPRADGTIIHVVQYGQFLENIAKAYNMPLNTLLEQNYLNINTVIFPGDKLVIQPSTTAVATGGAAGTVTPQSGTSATPQSGEEKANAGSGTATDRPIKITATPTAAPPEAGRTPVSPGAPLAPEAASSPGDPATLGSGGIPATSRAEARSGPDYLLILVIVLGVAGGGLIALGGAIKRIT